MRRKTPGLRALLGCGVLVAGLGTAVATAPPASAATANAIPAASLSAMSLNPYVDDSTTRNTVEAAGHPFTVVPMQTVVSTGYSTRAICHPTDVHSTTTPTGLCWTTTDDTTGNWFPQGITGSGDAVGSSVLYPTCASGCPGRKIVAVSWHSGAAYTEFGNDALARVSFADVTSSAADAFYRHALLVEPDTTTAGYHAIVNHADGIAWYGNYLFLVTGGDTGAAGAGRVIRVFDVSHFWQMSSTSSGTVGCTATACSAAYSLFALPEVGYYQFPDGNVCTPAAGNDPCFTSVSVDRSTTPNALVTTEFYTPGGGRILRWPLNSTSKLLQSAADGLEHPVEGWTSPVYLMQGAVMSGNHLVIDGLCPDGAPAVSYMPGGTSATSGPFNKSCLHKGTLDATRGTADIHYWTTAPGNSENLSYWPSSGELWLVNEYKGDGTGAYGSDRLVLDWSCAGLTCT